MFEAFHVTVHGAGHIKRSQPCEDYSTSLKEDSYQIFVVADGHGSSSCPRSKIGSEYVCRAAAEKLSDFAQALEKEHWEERLFQKKTAETLARQLITSIVAEWNTVVNEEFEANPLTKEERAGCGKYLAQYDRGECIEHIYGTTMIAGLLTKNYLLLLQQGDGRCDVFYKDGSVSQPIPWDDRCFSNVTTSMCDRDVTESCRYCVIDLEKQPVAAVMAGSDGVEDSFFSMDQMHSYYRDLLVYSAQPEGSVEKLTSYLEETLPDFSARGSQDDTTISGFIDRECVAELFDVFRRENLAVEVQTGLKYVEDRIASMESGKLQYLERKRDRLAGNGKTEEYETAAKEYDDYKARYKELLEERQKYQQKLKALKDGTYVEPSEERTEELPKEEPEKLPDTVSEHAPEETAEMDSEVTDDRSIQTGFPGNPCDSGDVSRT